MENCGKYSWIIQMKKQRSALFDFLPGKGRGSRSRQKTQVHRLSSDMSYIHPMDNKNKAVFLFGSHNTKPPSVQLLFAESLWKMD